MIKWIAIGDIHGQNVWKEIVNVELNLVDKIIFIGDYFDSFNISQEEQITNFLDILEFKRSYTDKVVLLIGNHDTHYLPGFGQCSGFNPVMSMKIKELLSDAIKNSEIQCAYNINEFLFTHAGVSNTWINNTFVGEEKVDENNLVSVLNDYLIYKPTIYDFSPGYYRNPYGDETCQGPLWIRPKSLNSDYYKDFIQVIGHTSSDEILIKNKHIVIDVLQNTNEYLKYDNNLIIKTFNSY